MYTLDNQKGRKAMGNKLYGTWNGAVTVIDMELYIGEKDGVLTAQASYPSIGFMHDKTKELKLEDEALELTVYINDFDCPLKLKLEGNVLKGTFSIQGMEVPAEFQKISEEYSFCDSYYAIPPQNIERLQKNSSFRNKPVQSVLTYELENQEVLEYLEKLGIKTENHHNLDTVMELMRQTMRVFSHDGANYAHSNEFGTIAQMEHAKGQHYFTNCRGISIIFSGILRAYGFHSSYIECNSVDPEDQEIHVVCETWIEELKKYVMVDISSKTIYYQNGMPLNLIELRKILMAHEEAALTVNEEASHNEEQQTMVERLAYFSKNLNFFRKCIDNAEHTEILKDNAICLAPAELLDFCKENNKICTDNIAEFYAM